MRSNLSSLVAQFSPLQNIPMQRSIQAPGMMRHGPYPGGLGTGLGTAVHHRSLDSPEQLLEKKLADQAAEMDRLLRENQRLAVTHVALRQDLGATQQEMQRINVHCRSVQTESDIQIRGLLEKIGKMEADIAAGEMLKKELQQVHLEAQSLINARQELTAEIQHVTNELQKADDDTRRLPEMHSELDALRHEHHKLRAAFEHEKGLNMDLVQRMHGMEKNLIALARDVEKLRAEVMNAEKGTQAPNPYGGSYSSPGSIYPPAGQAGGYPNHGQGGYPNHGQGGSYPNYGQSGGYTDGGYSQVSGYASAGYGHGGLPTYPQAYGSSKPQTPSGTAEGMKAYGSVGAGYSDGYGRSQVPVVGGAPAAAAAAAGGEGMNPYGSAYNGGRGGSAS